jgi:4-aminobutyrate aminotransferase-like enzyme/Ser/Thr protein kinase RdoA (MazF antagonist)
MTDTPPSFPVLETPAPDFTRDQAEQMALEYFGIRARAEILVSERDQNFRLRREDGEKFVLKIANPAESARVLEFQSAILEHAALCNPNLALPRLMRSVEGELIHAHLDKGTTYLLRVVTWLDGVPLMERGHGKTSPALRRAMGQYLAQLDKAMQGYFHPAAQHDLLWDVKRTLDVRTHLHHIKEPRHRELVENALDYFEHHIHPRLPGLRAQVIHNDMNPANVIVSKDDPDHMAGMIDFGDMVHAPLVTDLTVAATYQVFGARDIVGAVCDMLTAYQAVNPLQEEEIELIPGLIASRMAVSATIAHWRASEHPENIDYILADFPSTWRALEALAATDYDHMVQALRQAAGYPARSTRYIEKESPEHYRELLERRRTALGPAMRLFYDKPVHVVRGEGPWLFDSQGDRYLDSYNNVAHVGHAHPEVAAAIASQSRTLNTNTRYLHENIVELSERLAATLPGELSVCMFVCTGSEANDLALQIARANSGNRGCIVSAHAYHGNTTAVFQMSPEDCPREMRESWLETVPGPDVYGGMHRGEDAVARYASHLDQAIANLGERGEGTAGVIFDNIFSSEGVFPPPAGFLRAAYEKVRAAGGLCIADEVQSGFGRTGDHMWGFSHDGVIPDMVTLGKPMGNGHPIAAVITTPAIAEEFARKRHYFNTFGGNPVSCAAGLAVLRILEREQLQEHARITGEYLRKGLRELMARHELIGDVRGAGLFNAVELVTDRELRTPAVEHTHRVINRLKELGIFVGLTGTRSNAIKLRPPMVFAKPEADLLIESMDRALRDIG